MPEKQRTEETIEEKVIKLINEHSGYPIKEITPETDLINDLEMDELELLELTLYLEDKFKIEVSDKKYDEYVQYSAPVSKIIEAVKEAVNFKSSKPQHQPYT